MLVDESTKKAMSNAKGQTETKQIQINFYFKLREMNNTEETMISKTKFLIYWHRAISCIFSSFLSHLFIYFPFLLKFWYPRLNPIFMMLRLTSRILAMSMPWMLSKFHLKLHWFEKWCLAEWHEFLNSVIPRCQRFKFSSKYMKLNSTVTDRSKGKIDTSSAYLQQMCSRT